MALVSDVDTKPSDALLYHIMMSKGQFRKSVTFSGPFTESVVKIKGPHRSQGYVSVMSLYNVFCPMCGSKIFENMDILASLQKSNKQAFLK